MPSRTFSKTLDRYSDTEEQNMEIERKFLFHKLPDQLDTYPHYGIEQAYVTTNPVIRVRKKTLYQDMVQAAVADVVGPTVPAEDPQGGRGQQVGVL